MGRKNKGKNKWDGKPQKKVKLPEEQGTFVEVFENILFKKYYQAQFPEIPDAEFNLFWESLSQPLPVAFRVNATQQRFESLVERLMDGSLIKEFVTEECVPIQEVKWYPNHLVWESKIPKKHLRKSPQLAKLHQFIQKCNATGLISRQELVSMLPPLFLDPQPGEMILDMCAAPGSKTCQLLEMMNGGCIFANDVDSKRAYMLSHQLQRMATAQVIITNYPAQFYPTLHHKGQKLQFDKILCDVPCTGDGAARKLPSRWVKWSARDGNVIHPLQLSILMRSLQLCKVGGSVLYSTCSLNPIEDEAVVTEVFRRAGMDAFELVNLHVLPGFISRKGVSSWKVMVSDDLLTQEYMKYLSTKENEEYFKDFNMDDLLYEVQSVGVQPPIKKVYPKFSRKQSGQMVNAIKSLRPSLWPGNKEFMDKIGLEKTLRVMPHDQDTGGFYLALFKKKTNVIWSKPTYDESVVGVGVQQPVPVTVPAEEQPQQQQDIDIPPIQDEIVDVIPIPHEIDQEIQDIQVDEKEIKQLLAQTDEKIDQDLKFEQFQYAQINEYDWKILCEYYGIDELKFPRSQVLGTGQAMDPILQQNKKFRYVTKEVQEIMEDERNRNMKIINIGCKLFERGKESFGGQVSPFKVAQEGLDYVLPFITRRIIDCNKEQFLDVITRRNFRIEEGLSESIRDQIVTMNSGCFILRLVEEAKTEAVVCQFFRHSVSLMCTTEQIENIMIRHKLI